MEHLRPILGIFLFFALIAGLILIYQEEIQKAELFGKLQTSPVPKTVVGKSNVGAGSTIGGSTTTGTDTFTQSRNIRFGTGRIVDEATRDARAVTQGEVLHTITSGVNNYYARGFVEETGQLYEPSPYAGLFVFLDRTTNIKKEDPSEEYFILLASGEIQDSIDITGWKVFGREEKTSYRLPKGVQIMGSAAQKESIRVQAGETIIVSSGRSPIGQSFRVNKCSGYQSQFKKFTPTIKTNCPKPLDEFMEDGTVPFTDNECYETVNRMKSCTVLTDIPKTVTKECKIFLENVVLRTGCIERHRNDEDFFTKEWRIFLEQGKELWKNKDNVLYLLDENNKLVTTIVYR